MVGFFLGASCRVVWSTCGSKLSSFSPKIIMEAESSKLENDFDVRWLMLLLKGGCDD